MLQERIITGFVLALLMLSAIFFFPPFWFSLFIGAVIAIGGWEWARLAGFVRVPLRLAYVVLVVAGMWVLHKQSDGQRNLILLAGCLWWIFAYLLIRRYPGLGALWQNPYVLCIVGFLVLLPGWTALLQIRNSSFHIQLNLLLILMVTAADIGAYFTGRQFGKHKLAPSVSPNKTWEGFFGGMLGSALVALVALLMTDLAMRLPLVSLLAVMAAALAVAVLSVIGDLFESMVKRQAGVKDSGTILPGHGGILDRIDSLSAALPIFVLSLNLVPLA